MASEGQFLIERLNPAHHRREEFRCESTELTLFLRQRARKEMEALASACFVLVPVGDSGRIAGYYTLSASEITATDVPPAVATRLPRYPHLPATLLGRLARDEAFRGQGIGDRLVHDALRRAFAGSAEIGALAVITDPKDAKAERFYTDFGFRPFKGRRMFLPMLEIGRLLREPTS